MNYEQLERWACSAAQELQDFCDDAQEASGNPQGDDQLIGTRQLLKELDELNASDRVSKP